MLADTIERARRERLRFVMFWGHEPRGRSAVGPWMLSQWFPAEFEVDGDRYLTAEHFMMAEKARLFGDSEMRDAILESGHPGQAKDLGRRVRGFDQIIWNAERFDVVVRGNLAKFVQNPPLRDYLLATGHRVLVEASPRDHVWGIGMGARHPDAENPAAWRGENLLGFALAVVRARLREGTAPPR